MSNANTKPQSRRGYRSNHWMDNCKSANARFRQRSARRDNIVSPLPFNQYIRTLPSGTGDAVSPFGSFSASDFAEQQRGDKL
jgi:hypothetical protein